MVCGSLEMIGSDNLSPRTAQQKQPISPRSAQGLRATTGCAIETIFVYFERYDDGHPNQEAMHTRIIRGDSFTP